MVCTLAEPDPTLSSINLVIFIDNCSVWNPPPYSIGIGCATVVIRHANRSLICGRFFENSEISTLIIHFFKEGRSEFFWADFGA
jgi:hypothetical protein